MILRFFIVGLILFMTATGAQAGPVARIPCSADCDGSGDVTVDELLRLVSMALGENDLANCACADENADDAVTVDELLSAVADALEGCPTLSAESLARAAVTWIRGLIYTPAVQLPVSLGLAGAGPDPDPCRTAGGFANSCEEIAAGFVRIAIQVVTCETDVSEGRAMFDGDITLTAGGSCPDVVDSGNIRLELDLNGRVRDMQSSADVEPVLDLDVRIARLGFGLPPCRLKGANSEVDGRIVLPHAVGSEISLDFGDVRSVVDFAEHDPTFDCEPSTISGTLFGPLRVTDAERNNDTCGTADALRVRWLRQEGQVTLDGRISSPELGGNVEWRTSEPLAFRFGDLCLRGGELSLATPRQTVDLTFREDASVIVHSVDDEIVLENIGCGECGDGVIDASETCDDGNTEAGDGCSDRCIEETCYRCDGEPSTCSVAEDGAPCDDELTCTGDDTCRAGRCSVHSEPCLFVADQATAKVLAVDLETFEQRIVSDRGQLMSLGGIAREAAGTLLVTTNDTGTGEYGIVRIDLRTGAQSVVFTSTLLDGASDIVIESPGTVLVASPRCCEFGLGGVVRIDLEAGTEEVVWVGPHNEGRFAQSIALLGPESAVVSYLNTRSEPSQEPGRLYEVDPSRGEGWAIPVDTTLLEPRSLRRSPGGSVYVVDAGVGAGAQRVLRVDLDSGTTEAIAEDGLLENLFSIAFDEDGRIYVGDGFASGGRIIRIDPDSGAQAIIVGSERLTAPVGLVITPTSD